MKSRNRSKVRAGRAASRRGSTSSRRKLARPFVSATFAMTLDGKITTRTFAPVDFTSREDKQHLFRQRALADAVLLGHTTLKRDNVRLGLPKADLRDARIERGQMPYPIRVIVSNQGKIDNRLNIFQSDISPIIIFLRGECPRNIDKPCDKKRRS